MPNIRFLVALVVTLATRQAAIAESPMADAPVLTREFPGDSLEVPLSEAFPGLDESLSYDLDILTEDGESYATRMATLYDTIEPLCHVATISSSQAILERCRRNPAAQVAEWRKILADLRRRLASNSSTVSSPATTPNTSNNPAAAVPDVYLVDSGKTFISLTRQSIEEVLRGTSSFPPPSQYHLIHRVGSLQPQQVRGC